MSIYIKDEEGNVILKSDEKGNLNLHGGLFGKESSSHSPS